MANLPPQHEVCFIDANIHSMRDVALHEHLQVINLHCNSIAKIENLHRVTNLQHLDLSSNCIVSINGLDGLSSLRTLNLSCNLIESIDGLQDLRCLVHLDLSYNRVHDVSGLRSMEGSDFSLRELQLHGNELNSVEHIIESMKGLNSMQELMLELEGSSNPVCSMPGYRSAVLNSIPSLVVLDGLNRLGEAVQKQRELADIPGLEGYLDFLLSSDVSTSAVQEAPINIITPKIDQVLERFRQRALISSDGLNTSSTTDVDHHMPSLLRRQAPSKIPGAHGRRQEETKTSNHEDRIRELEQRLAEVVKKREELTSKVDEELTSSTTTTDKVFPKGHHHKRTARRDTDLTDDSDGDVRTSRSSSKERKMGKKVVSKTTTSKGHSKPSSRIPQARTSTSINQKKQDPVSCDSTQGIYRKVPSSSKQLPSASRNITSSSAEQDSEKLLLLQELDSERERRWKAEQAAIRLADHVKSLQSKASEERELQDVTLEATSRLKKALMNEKETRLRLEQELDEVQAKLKEVSTRLDATVKSEGDKHQTLRAMEATARQLEAERLQQQAHEAKRLQEYQLKVGALSRELDLIKNQAKQSEAKIQQLQELLANREQEHRKEIAAMYRLDSKEIQEVIDKQIERERQSHQREHQLYQQKIEELSHQYSDLEDEFRLALRLEADRYQQVQDAYDSATLEAAKYKESIETALIKEKRASGLVSELTAMVKEQKVRIAELSKSKQEMLSSSKENVSTMERQLEEARRKLLQYEVLKKENSELRADLVAHESVMDGLKAERKLWGQELAQQGASLAQDRGRLEARIEVLNAEVVSLKKQLEQDSDALKIKTKVIDDQTETIKKLKEALLERDDQLKSAREENLDVQRSLETQLGEEQSANQEMREQIERLQERKEELKHQVQEVQLELDESQRAYKTLDQKWKDKGDLISTLEEQVRQVKKTFDEREQKLKDERDKALQQEKAVQERMRAMDDAFRQQLGNAQKAHEEEIDLVKGERQQELDQAHQKVLQVEDEMRQLLTEAANQKRVMEEKVKRLTRAFSDLQTELG